MHRRDILSKLDHYRRQFPEEAAVIDRMVSFITEHDDCFHRELKIGHLTGSAWLLDAKLERALLTHHRKLDRWLQPGGHADGESDLVSVSLREAKEESGLGQIVTVSPVLFDIDIHLIPERGDEAAHYHYDCRFLLRSVGDDRYTVSEESHDLAWILLEDIEKYTQEISVTRMVEKTQRVKSESLML